MDKKKQYALLLALHYDHADPKKTLAMALEHLGVDSDDFSPNPGVELRKLQDSVKEGADVYAELHKLTFFSEEVRFLLSVSTHLALEYLQTTLTQ